jgi:hypothetical protein
MSVVLVTGNPPASGIVFQDNFDSQPDWSTPVQNDQGSFKVGGTTYPVNWHGYYNGMSYLSPPPPAFRWIYINSIPGYPYETSGTGRGGSGKCLTFWDEAIGTAFTNSDGWLMTELSQEYPELYISFYILFGRAADGSGYRFLHTGAYGECGAHKYFRFQHYLSGNPWSYFSANYGNQPIHAFDVGSDFGSTKIQAHYRGYGGDGNTDAYYLQGVPPYVYDVPNDFDMANYSAGIGNIATVLLDSLWHRVKIRLKMNTYNAGTGHFNANGVYQFWLDGVLKDTRTAIPWNQDGAPTSPIRGWRLFGLGGNNNFWFSDKSNDGRWQWYAIDDLVISTEDIP